MRLVSVDGISQPHTRESNERLHVVWHSALHLLQQRRCLPARRGALSRDLHGLGLECSVREVRHPLEMTSRHPNKVPIEIFCIIACQNASRPLSRSRPEAHGGHQGDSLLVRCLHPVHGFSILQNIRRAIQYSNK